MHTIVKGACSIFVQLPNNFFNLCIVLQVLLGLTVGSDLSSTFLGCSARFFGKKAAFWDCTCSLVNAKTLLDLDLLFSCFNHIIITKALLATHQHYFKSFLMALIDVIRGLELYFFYR